MPLATAPTWCRCSGWRSCCVSFWRLRGHSCWAGSEHGLTVPSLTELGPRFRLLCLQLTPRLHAFTLLLCDVDGVLTDAGLHYNETGQVSKRFDVRDGLAVRMLQRSGVHVALLSGGRSGAIEQRAQHLEKEHNLVGVGDNPSPMLAKTLN